MSYLYLLYPFLIRELLVFPKNQIAAHEPDHQAAFETPTALWILTFQRFRDFPAPQRRRCPTIQGRMVKGSGGKHHSTHSARAIRFQNHPAMRNQRSSGLGDLRNSRGMHCQFQTNGTWFTSAATGDCWSTSILPICANPSSLTL